MEYVPDISIWDTKAVQNMSFLFFGCSSLCSLPEIGKWNTSNVTDMSFMFAAFDSKINIYDYFNAINIIKGEENKPISKNDIFEMYNKINENNINLIDYCVNPYNVNENTIESYFPDISSWDTGKVTDMSGMFFLCTSLEVLPNISKWNTSRVNNISGMFNSCSSLIFINLSNWDVKNIVQMSCLFMNCSSLSYIFDLSKWETNELTHIKAMFYNCFSLEFGRIT